LCHSSNIFDLHQIIVGCPVFIDTRVTEKDGGEAEIGAESPRIAEFEMSRSRRKPLPMLQTNPSRSLELFQRVEMLKNDAVDEWLAGTIRVARRCRSPASEGCCWRCQTVLQRP
jgi:hypothetical protein